mmetsp:Transcript_107658/g.313166  ORF Transcript_107658/g.313166 Transcript_107658/m.313166 type:complete len:142 (-) Transcript_107658:129-554(-)
MFMTLLFYVLPIIARKICQSFRCTSYDMGDEDPLSLLIADVSIDCQTDEYWAMFFFACLMVLVYPIGTPMCLLFMLFKHRKRLNPPMPDDLNEVELHLHMKKVAEDRREVIFYYFLPRGLSCPKIKIKGGLWRSGVHQAHA